MNIKSFVEQYKYYLIGACAVLLVIVYFAAAKFTAPAETLSFDSTQTEPAAEEVTEESVPVATTVFVEVKGAVNTPGVYELPVDGRVKNVLDIAGLRENADLMTVNQSAKLADEMVIYIPYEGEIDEAAATALVTADSQDETSGELVNINTADLSQLTTLNGIGEKKAQAIMAYREEQGLFGTLEELKNIPGIGDKTFENLKPYITIN